MGSWWLLMVNTTFVLVIFMLVVSTKAANEPNTVEQKMREDTDLSQFYSLLEDSQVASALLNHVQLTIFAPINMAFKSGVDIKDKQTLGLYHMTSVGLTLDQLPPSMNSQIDGNPPLWITRRKVPGQHKEEIYVNNALIIRKRSDYVKVINGKTQVLHLIDSVLEPVMTNPEISAQVYNPDALQFLNQSESLNLGFRVRSFRQRIKLMNKGDIFKAVGKHTFFIPVEEGFMPPPRPDKIDQKVIDGHVIAGEVLFTAATELEKEYDTLANSDMVRVTVSFSRQPDGKSYVKSNTVVGDATHATGVVPAEIVKANIPVKNGVVHLIQRPLMVVDNDVKQFLESFKENKDGPLNKFYNIILNYGDEFLKNITRMDEVTLFAPSNEAWGDQNTINNIVADKKKLKEILNLHLVERRLRMDTIEKNISEVPTLAERKSLYFNIIHGTGNNSTLTVEGGGVNATVIQPNIAATNGIIHIIDKVLGVPFSTLRDKLATDPTLNKTFFLGKQLDFNSELANTKKVFTYFVPRDLAWQHTERNDPSTYKKLFMNEFGYHVRQILERHLVVSDRKYTMADLKLLAANDSTVTLPTYRDHLKLKVKETTKKTYAVEWQGVEIAVVRPDVECTNGIIHVIDGVFLKDSDIRVTAGVSIPFLAPHLAMLLMAKWLLL